MNHFSGHNLFPSAGNVGRERSKDEWDHYPQYSEYSGSLPGNRSGSSSEWGRPGSSSQNWNSEKQEPEDDPDGQPYESEEEEDPELARKRKELQVIQEQIMLKRASLALKTVDLKTVNPGFCIKEATPRESDEPLRDRVKLILMQRNRMIGTKGPVAKTRSSSINIEHNHPLKHKVKVALEQRFLVDRPVEMQNFEQIPFFESPPHPQIDSPAEEEEEEGNQGFIRFLNILNKGVDIDKLKEMVIDDTDDTDGTPQPPHNSQCHNGREIHRTRSSFSDSPVEKSPSKEEQQQKTTPDEQQQHLQNILRSLGLSLGTDEMSKLTDRTQERLYGKRQRSEEEDRTLDEKPQSEDELQPIEGEEKYSPAHYTRASSSSSTSSLASSRSQSGMPSPQRRHRSHSSSHRHGNQQYTSPPSSPRPHRRSSSLCRNSNSRKDSRSPHRHRNSNSPYRKKDSSSLHRLRRKDSRSLHRDRHRNSNSPYRRKDSHSPHRRRSLSSESLRDPLLEFQPPTQPYPHPSSSYFNPHFPPQMYPDPYSQYYYNYWPFNQPPAPGSVDLSSQNYSQTIPHNSSCSLGPYPEETEFPSFSEMDDMPNTSKKRRITRCLVTVKEMCVPEYIEPEEKKKNNITYKMCEQKLKLYRMFNGQTTSKQTVPHKKTKSSNLFQTAGTSWAPNASQSLPNKWNVTGQKKKRKKKKKKSVFIERNAKMEELLNDRPGAVTRSLAEKNPAKLGYDGKLVEIKDIEEPLQELWCDLPLNVTVAKTGKEKNNAEPKEEKPVLTEEEIKANLKLKLEAFNSRMKKTLKQPATVLTPQKTKVEDEL